MAIALILLWRQRYTFWIVSVVLGIGLSAIVVLPLFSNPFAISNHGDINRALIYQGVAKKAVLSGHLPLWEPYLCGGTPLLANLESWFLQPFFLLTLPLADPVALKMTYALTLVSTFLGLAALGRIVIRFSPIPALVFALIGTFSGYLTHHLAEGYFTWIGMAWVPWFILLACLSMRRPWLIPVAAIMPVFIFGSGSMSLVFFSVIFLGLVGSLQALRERSWQPVLTLLAILAFSFLLAAPKLLPSITLLFAHDPRPGVTPSLSLLPAMLLTREFAQPIVANGINYRWSEFGNYIGVIGLVLSVAGGMFMRFNGKRSQLLPITKYFLAASLIMLALVFLPWPASSPGILRVIVELLRMPTRLMFFPIMGLGILAAYGMEILIQAARKKLLSPVLVFGLVIMLVIELLSYDQQLFQRTFTIPLPSIHRQKDFFRVDHAFTSPLLASGESRYYRTGYIDYLNNRGTNDVCRYYQSTPTTVGQDTTKRGVAYRGEAYLVEPGEIIFKTMEPGHIIVHTQTVKNNLLVINQSYDSGWRAQGQQTVNADGLLAAPVPAGANRIEFIYSPLILSWALGFCLLGLVLGLAWIYVWF